MRLKGMNQKTKLFCAIFVTNIIVFNIVSMDATLKGVTSWIRGIKEETFFKEIPFDSHGTIILENETGSIIIKSWNFPKIAIEALKKAPTKELSLLDIETSLLSNQLLVKSINSSKNGSIDYQLIVPTNTNIICTGKNCSVKTKNIGGVHQITTNNTIDIQGACNSIHAVSSGAISIGFVNLPAHINVSLKSMKSTIALILPHHCNASLKATTQYNSISSKQLITLKPVTLLLNKQNWDQLKKTIDGIIGIGGPVIDIAAYNGITIQ